MMYGRRNLGEAEAMPRCGRSIMITAEELERLERLSNAVEAARWRVDCELIVGHTGDHLAFVIAVDHGEQWWWIRWDSGRRRLEPADLCDVAERDDQKEDDCLLPRRPLNNVRVVHPCLIGIDR